MVPENLSEPAGASVPTVTKSPRPTGRGGGGKRKGVVNNEDLGEESQEVMVGHR